MGEAQQCSPKHQEMRPRSEVVRWRRESCTLFWSHCGELLVVVFCTRAEKPVREQKHVIFQTKEHPDIKPVEGTIYTCTITETKGRVYYQENVCREQDNNTPLL